MFMKTAISIPDSVYEAAEELAHRLGISRSHLYATAVERYLSEHSQQEVIERLNQVYRGESARVDPILESLQVATLDLEDW